MTAPQSELGRIVADARAELDALCANESPLQEALVARQPDDLPPVALMLAVWSLGIVALHWRPTRDPRDAMGRLMLLHEVADRRWNEASIRLNGVALSRMLAEARPPHDGIRVAARLAAGAISLIAPVELVAHKEIESR